MCILTCDHTVHEASALRSMTTRVCAGDGNGGRDPCGHGAARQLAVLAVLLPNLARLSFESMQARPSMQCLQVLSAQAWPHLCRQMQCPTQSLCTHDVVVCVQ